MVVSRISKIVFLFACLFLLCFSYGMSQQEALSSFNQKRLQTSTRAMYILGGWAIGNIAIGGIRRSRTLGEKRYFHEMNIFWNLVNLGIAGAALYGNAKADPAAMGLWESLNEQQRLEKILWFNVALNGSYILGGAWLKERAKTSGKNPERLRGYGNSLILQGSFLFVYDLVHVFIQQAQSAEKIQTFLSHVQFTGNSLALRFIF